MGIKQDAFSLFRAALVLGPHQRQRHPEGAFALRHNTAHWRDRRASQRNFRTGGTTNHLLSWTEQAPTSKQRQYLRSLKKRLGDRAAQLGPNPKSGYDASAQIAHAEALLEKDT